MKIPGGIKTISCDSATEEQCKRYKDCDVCPHHGKEDGWFFTDAEVEAIHKRIAELERVEWYQQYNNCSPSCPWCDRYKQEGHAPDCPRGEK